MAACQSSMISLHEDPDLFHEAVYFTAGRTGMNAALVEKDYYCSLLLSYLYQELETPLVFRGGTCLCKIYSDFYRLSEDLDFVISIPSDAPRSERRRKIVLVKECLSNISKDIPVFGMPKGVKGYNNSKQYIAYMTYKSSVAIAGEPAQIKIEVGLREKVLVLPIRKKVHTLLMNPFNKKPAVPEFEVMVLTMEEAYAEKIRAALTRKEPAIRDFYDIDFAVTKLNLDMKKSRFMDLVTKKLKVPDNDPIDTSYSRKAALHAQLDTQLKPILRQQDFECFDLDRAFELIAETGSGINKA